MKKIIVFFNREQNLLIHFIISIIVFVASIYFKLNTTEWFLVIGAIGFVITTELFNSAIEIAVDNYTKKFNELGMIAKDTAAAAVVISAFTSVIIGIYVFIPKLIDFIK